MAMILSPVGGHDVADFNQAVRITEQQAQAMEIPSGASATTWSPGAILNGSAHASIRDERSAESKAKFDK
jgi:hypothetical protein